LYQGCNFRSILHFDFVNEKCQVTKERLYFEKRKRGRESGVTEEVAGQLKSKKKEKSEREKQKSLPSFIYGF
jgi:hypothetical protein